jgi:hypothetical protein
MKVCGERKYPILLHTFPTLPLDGEEWPASSSDFFNLGWKPSYSNDGGSQRRSGRFRESKNQQSGLETRSYSPQLDAIQGYAQLVRYHEVAK